MPTSALVSGTLFRAAERRTAKSGRDFTVATVKATDGQTATFWRVTAFNESIGEQLARLNEGEAVAVQGRLDISTYDRDGETRVSYQIIAEHVLALRQMPQARRPRAVGSGQGSAQSAGPAPTREERFQDIADPRFNDDPPF